MVTFCERFFLNTLLNGREEKGEKWRENEEEGLSSYSVTLRKYWVRGYLKQEALYYSLCRNRFGRWYAPVVQTECRMNEIM